MLRSSRLPRFFPGIPAALACASLPFLLLAIGCGGSSNTATVIQPSAPQISISPNSLTFGSVNTGVASAAQTVTITNTGNAALTISNIAITGDFAQTSNGCSASLAANATCQTSVTFTPTAPGARSGTLTYTSNASSSPSTVALSGTGVTPIVYTGLPFQATVQAGSKTIAGASVQLWAAGTTGSGSKGTALLASAVTASAQGVATIPASYNCPSATSLVYLVSNGGTVAGSSSANSNAVQLAGIGPCSSITSGSKYVISEATTVAAVAALAPFYSVSSPAGGAIGASATNLTGLTNAFATAATLASVATGTSPGASLPANAASPAARVNSLANLLNACVTSASACTTLYSSTTAGTVVPTNTLDAAYLLATHPTANVSALYAQSLASTAYTPVLQAVPADWTMFLTVSGAGMNSPSGLGVDSKGNVWVSSYFNTASEFTPAGAAVFPNGVTGAGLNNSYGLAIDLNDNVWVPNEQPNNSAGGIGSVTELSSAGAALSGSTGYINGGLNYPLSIAIDPNGTVWVVDYGNSHLTLLNTSGTPLSGSAGYTTSLFAFPVAVAIDSNHFGWVVNQASNFLTKVAPDGSSFTNYDCCNLASGLAIDQGNNIWVANYFGDNVSLVANSGTVLARNLTGSGSVYHPQGVAIDGNGTVWIANYRAAWLTELAGSSAAVPGAALSPATGIGGDAALLEAYAIAIDASGDIWVTNQGSNTLTKFIGLATPVKTPLSGLPKQP